MFCEIANGNSFNTFPGVCLRPTPPWKGGTSPESMWRGQGVI